MFKMFKYLKSSALAIIAIVVLLVGQAICDLALPDYTSKIVNVGIQNGGIETLTPDVIRQSEFNKLTSFLNSNDKNFILSQYSLISNDGTDKLMEETKKNPSVDINKLPKYEVKKATDDEINKYPIIKDEPVFILNKIKTEDKNKISELLQLPILLSEGFKSDKPEMQVMKDSMMAKFKEQQSQMSGNQNANMSNGNIPNTNEIDPNSPDFLFMMFENMTDVQKDEFLAQVKEQFNELPETMFVQIGSMYLKGEYKQVGINTDNIQTMYIIKVGLIMLGISLLAGAAAVLVGFLSAKTAARLGQTLRHNVFSKVISFSNNEFDKFSTASLITRSTNDIQQVQMLMVMLLRIVFYAPILGIGGILKVTQTNTSMSWVIAVAVISILSLVLVLFAIVMPKFKIVQKLVDRLNLVTREILEGLSVIRAFSTQKHEEKRFTKANSDLTKTNLFVNRVMSLMMPAMMFIMNGVTLLIIFTGAKSIDAGNMQVGDLFAFIQYTMQIIMSFLMISMFSIMLPRASVSAGRIDEIIKTETEIKDAHTPKHFNENQKGYVEFNDVTFRYPNAEEDVLKNISFASKPGQTTAIIGSTGSGKSTLINLIPRFYDVTQGQVLVDGVDIKEVPQKELRQKIGFVPQKGVLFSGTVESNIKFADENAPDEIMVKAAQIAQAEEFINQKEDKYESEISQGGTNVSGGQKQRLSIARAILTRPEIYIFDDSFSALDYKTDITLRKALKEYTENGTVIIVAQRISTIIHADQILVLDEGEIVGKGTHKELLKSCEVYKQIALSQLSKEELENE